ncbi:hypothetical protein [Candidatus Enterococcus mansonii]|nr:hypothetical protein [Enterococcus sp. 4G2_DIV0659]
MTKNKIETELSIKEHVNFMLNFAEVFNKNKDMLQVAESVNIPSHQYSVEIKD